MGHNSSIPCLVRQLDCSCRFRQRSNLIDLDQHRIGCFSYNSLCNSLRVGHKQIVSHKLHFFSDSCCQSAPSIPILFIQRIFNRINRIVQDQFFIILHHLFRCSCNFFSGTFAFSHKIILLFFLPVQFRRCHIQSNPQILAWLISRLPCCLKQKFDGLSGISQFRCKTTFVTDSCCKSLLLQKCSQYMINFSSHT